MPPTAADRHDARPTGRRDDRADSIPPATASEATADAAFTARSALREPTVPKSRLPD